MLVVPGGGQSLFGLAWSPPNASAMPAPSSTAMPKSGAPFVPQLSSPPQQASAPLVIERQSKCDVSDDGIAEPVVLDDVLEDAFDACAGPVAAELEGPTIHPEL